MKAQIRKATENDLSELAKLTNELGYAGSTEQLRERLAELSETNDHSVFVAVFNEEVAGWVHCFVALRLESDPFAEIGGLVVSKVYQGMGIGKRLIEKVIEWSLNKQLSRVYVRTNSIREQAHRFYESCGFQQAKTQKIYSMNLLKEKI